MCVEQQWRNTTFTAFQDVWLTDYQGFGDICSCTGGTNFCILCIRLTNILKKKGQFYEICMNLTRSTKKPNSCFDTKVDSLK